MSSVYYIYLLVSTCICVSTNQALTTCKDTADWCSGYAARCNNPDVNIRKNCMLTCQYCTSGNVAYGKPTNQSSDYDIGYESIYAVDGKRETGVDAKCTLTNETDTISWWCVDLMNSYHVSKMDIYTDDLEAGGFSVRLSEHGQCDQTTFESASVCYNDRHLESDSMYSLTSCNEGETKFEGRLVFINTIEKQTAVDLCEVEIYSVYCSPGFYESGDVCLPCNCNGNTCNPTTGACVISCSPNCINNRCDVAGNCQDGCHTGYYGNTCDQTCSSSCKDKTCDSSSGDCLECNGAFHGNLCDKNCTNCNNSVCNITNGVCLYGCKEGFHGSAGLCGLTCPNCKPGGCYMESGICINGCVDGFYGPGGMCELECPNCLPGGCAKTSGECNNGCKDGFHGNNCESRCPACTSGRCKRKTGSCIDGCPTGFYGKTCQKNCSNCLGGLYDCDKKGKCNNGCKDGFYGSGGKCGKKCKQCLPVGCVENTGACIEGCPVGFYGSRCTFRCNASCENGCAREYGDCLDCTRGRFGTHCQQNCSKGCLENSCSREDGSCSCQRGFYGDRCDRECSDTCLNKTCEIPPGAAEPRCTEGCVDGYSGSHCRDRCPANCERCPGGTCTSCSLGYYGEACNKGCPVTCVNGCDKNTGTCSSCGLNFFGEFCNMSCSDGCLTKVQQQVCGDDGTCSIGCVDGRYGGTCNLICSSNCQGICRRDGTCPQCIDGYFGDNCTQECNPSCKSTCGKNDGKCDECTSGYYGNFCNLTCSSNCAENCNEDGSCGKCKDGFYGDFCNEACSTNCLNSICMKSGSSIRCTEGCINGKAGEDCSDDCLPHCISCRQYNKLLCTACEEGWRGYDCSYRCSSYMSKNCKTCHQTEWRCLSCNPGWYGEKCTYKCFDGCLNTVCDIDGSCSNCTLGYFGPRCNKTCPEGCLGGECNTDGTCHGCMTGKFGEYCKQTCPLQCLKGKCNLDGVCSDGCKDGRYGEKCEKICSTGCKVTDVHPRCEYRSGKCIDGCVAGKKGDNCSEDCDKNLYGKNCLQNCGFCFADEGCDGVTGECSSEGCQEGYTGIMCIEEVDGGSNYAAVGGGIVVLLVVILAAVVVGFVWRRGRQSKGDQISPETVPLKPPSASPDTVVTVSPPDAECDDSIYQNTGDNSISPTAIPISNIWNAIAKKEDINEFTKEFKSLPIGLCCPHEIALSPENKAKNRYKMVCAFDHTRVKMDIINDDPNSDYINACYISGYRQVTPPYIAAQGPTPVNINDFWRMIWVVNSGKIVMLTNLVELGNVKCLQYWPEQGQVAKYGLISVKMLKEDQYARFTIRTLDVTRIGCGRRTIKQFHYTSWPDKSIPPDAVSLAEFTDKVDRCNSQCSGPLVVHCSAGIGRTGTFLAFNFLIEEAMDTGYVDVLGCVKRMRFERVNMVQTQDQYVFLHKMIALWKLLQKTSAPVTSFQPVLQSLLKSNSSTGKCGLQEKYDLMEKHRPIIEDSEFETALSEDNRKKNRDLSIVACETHRAYISNPASAEDSTDYINAVFLPSYSAKRGYVLTHSPLNNTVTDFWCLVVDTNIQTIVDFDSFSGNASVQYIPNKDTTLQMGSYLVKCLGQDTETENYILKTCQVQHIEEAEEITVKIYLCKVRFNDMVVPFSPLPLFHILGDIQNSGDRNPILVHCLDGVEKSGLFCTLGAIVDRLTKEQHVSVLQVIQQLRLVRPQIITNYQQFRFCFNAVGEYLDYFSDYANSA